MRTRFILYPLVCCVLALSACGIGRTDRPNPGPGWQENDPSANLLVMTYNILHCAPFFGPGNYGTPDVGNVAKVLKARNADVVLLQEVDSCTKRSLGVHQAKELARLAGYPYWHYFKQKEYGGGSYGAGMLSKYPLRDIVNHPLPRTVQSTPVTGSNILGSARVTIKGTAVTVATVHLSAKNTERTLQFPYMLQALDGLEAPVILGGDFNSRPDSDIIAALDGDGFERTNHDPTKFTIPSTAPKSELDYLCFKPAKAFEVVSHTVFTGTVVSDHLPVLAVLKSVN